MIRQQDGFTLIEAMISSMLLAAVVMSVGSIQNLSSSMQQSIQASMDYGFVVDQINAILSNEATCTLAFTGGPYSGGGPNKMSDTGPRPVTLYKAPGAILFDSVAPNNKHGLVVIQDISVDALPGTARPTGAGIYPATLKVTLQRTINGVQTNRATVGMNVNLTLNGGLHIVECTKLDLALQPLAAPSCPAGQVLQTAVDGTTLQCINVRCGAGSWPSLPIKAGSPPSVTCCNDAGICI